MAVKLFNSLCIHKNSCQVAIDTFLGHSNSESDEDEVVILLDEAKKHNVADDDDDGALAM